MRSLMITQYCSSDQIEKRWAVHVACTGKKTGEYKFMVEKPEGKRSLGRSCRRREDDFKMDLQEVERGHGLDRAGAE
jgi:hypothetical protein